MALRDYLKRHFFFALAGAAFLLMFGFVLLKEVGLFGKSKGASGPPAAAATGKGGAAKAGGRPAVVALSTADVRVFSDRVQVPGNALANESITVTSKVQDVVEEVRFESGQYVNRGEVLIILARTEQSADLGGARSDVAAAFDDASAAMNEINAASRDLEAARAGIVEAEANRNEAKLNYDRVAALAERGFASKARLDSAKAQLQTADSRLQVARERAEGAGQRLETQRVRANALTRRARSVDQRSNSAQSRLADRIIRAPFSGRIGLRNVSPGQLARPGDSLATLDDISEIKVDFDVPENRLASVQVGTEVVIRSSAYPDEVYKATVRFVDTRVDPRSRTIRARAYIPNPAGRLRPGMLLSVDLLTPDRQMPAVPEVALLEEGNATYVFIANGSDKDGMTAKRVPISVGMRKDGFAEVLTGLPVGAKVVTEGLVGLRDGQPIKPQGAPSSKTPDGKAGPATARPDGRGG